MNELTDLEICKRIAEIENLEHYISENKKYCMTRDKLSTYVIRHVEYNPLTDDALCFNLMIKYGIRYDGRKIKGKHHFWFGNIKNKNYIVNFNPNRAICIAIIKSKV
jgi:hypothetical protein